MVSTALAGPERLICFESNFIFAFAFTFRIAAEVRQICDPNHACQGNMLVVDYYQR